MMPRCNSTERPKPPEPDQYAEKKKTVVNTSPRLAFFYDLIHLFPVFVYVLLVTVNLKAVYIGPALEFQSCTTTDSLAALQGPAKVQELSGIASMTTIVFDIVLHQMLHGEGLPLGLDRLVSSGLSFSRFDFLYSMATWVWLWSVSAKGRRALVVFGVTITALLALVVRPARAVLMLPRHG
ncbi:hypothetical protein N7G274_004441 [Stereocaulon virgatum]|uniref:Uncharacterized protein n=1 Tax=Stereocaulon virgatum TaxID=373712 RepID=A0ABR4A9X9_9LECA